VLDALRSRGRDREELHSEEAGLLGVLRHDWELAPWISGNVLLARDQESSVVVAADAALYYRDDLVHAVEGAGILIRGRSPAELILSAYLAWGDSCPERLEGDFAFILWDGRRRRVLAARDFAGKRPLFHAEFGGMLFFASTIPALLAAPGANRDLDWTVIAEAAAALTNSPDETAFRAVRRLPAGSTLLFEPGSAPRVHQHWRPPIFRTWGGRDAGEAAAELLTTLERAVDERMAGEGVTACFLSGGYDSPAVYAAGRRLSANNGARRELRAISMSFPPGDSGREDEFIEQIVGHWNDSTSWIQSADVPFCEDPEEHARQRAEPFPHLFEAFNRVATRVAVGQGARVVLDGSGGDQLFAVGANVLADLFRGGHWLRLASDWRALGGGSWRDFFKVAVQPRMGPAMLRAASWFRGGRPLADVGFVRDIPPWFSVDFVERHELRARERDRQPVRGTRSWSAYEALWYLTTPAFPRMAEYVACFALEEGAEYRSPLLDGRIVELAATRPASERRRGTETKLLLRHAMENLLPAPVIAGRPHKTGMPIDYMRASARALLGGPLRPLLRDSALAQAGIVEPEALRRAVERCVAGQDDGQAVPLYLTLQAELWVRQQVGG
jgi:asparagine synthase (glutamine-hydrolysing)